MGKSGKLDMGLALVGSNSSRLAALWCLASDLVVYCRIPCLHDDRENLDAVRLQPVEVKPPVGINFFG